MQAQSASERIMAKEESQLVTFLLKDEEFGFDIMSVQEIIRLPKMAKVPRSPAYVDGIANLRGVVLPIIDMRPRFGMDRTESTDRTRVLVVDIDGVKTGLRVDRVKQVTRVSRGEMETPPPAIRGTSAHYLDGVVKLEKGQRIIMALNAGEVCRIESAVRGDAQSAVANKTDDRTESAQNSQRGAEAVSQMVTFRIAREEFAFPMDHVREILRVQAPTQVPDVPDYVLGVLTVRGQILPIVDLRRLLNQPTLADEVAHSCRDIRTEYEKWARSLQGANGHWNVSAAEGLREWLTSANSSSQILMETLSRIRGLNEKVIKQVSGHAGGAEISATAQELTAGLEEFEREIAGNIHEDQRIIVVDANGFVIGLVVDHVNEVLNVPRRLLDPPPIVASGEGAKLEAVAKLDEGNRLIMLLDVANLVGDQKLLDLHNRTETETHEELHAAAAGNTKAVEEMSELQLVTFMLGDEEYGVPIARIQEIDRLSKITKVPNVARFVEGVTNLRGEVIPVLDTRKRFALETRESDDRTRIMIVELGGVKTGLIVDSVREVISLSKADIAPPPEAIGSGMDQQFISGIGKVDSGKRMIVLLDVEKILSRQEQAKLAEIPTQQ